MNPTHGFPRSPKAGLQAPGASFVSGDNSGGVSQPPVRPAAGSFFRDWSGEFAAWSGVSPGRFLLLLTMLGFLMAVSLAGVPLVLAGLGIGTGNLGG